MKHRGWIAFSGFLWFAIGGSLLYKGLKFISLGPSQEMGTMLIALGLAIGFLKGRFVLSKTVARVSSRIASLPLPIRFKDAFSKSYWILIGCMMALGMLFRFLPISVEVRGVIDVAIGSALINGAMLYFRAAKNY
jgi:hypothetical protein